MKHFKAITMANQQQIMEGVTPDVNQFMVAVIKQLASQEISQAAITILCDGKMAFQVRHYVVVGQTHHVSIKAVDLPRSKEARGDLLAALYRSADEAQLRGSYVMANQLLNQASVLAHSPLGHPESTQMVKQATRLLAYGVEAISKMSFKLQTLADVMAIEQIEINATLANIEGELISLSFLDKHGLLNTDVATRVVQLGTAVANLVIGTQYRQNRIANEVITLGERLFGSVWIDALLRA